MTQSLIIGFITMLAQLSGRTSPDEKSQKTIVTIAKDIDELLDDEEKGKRMNLTDATEDFLCFLKQRESIRPKE
jgi:hypothetical protein